MKPITAAAAEISVDFPDKAYIGSFGQHSEFSVSADPQTAAIRLVHSGEDRRVAEIHLPYYLLAEVLAELAVGLASPSISIDEFHRSAIRDAAAALANAAKPIHRQRKARTAAR